MAGVVAELRCRSSEGGEEGKRKERRQKCIKSPLTINFGRTTVFLVVSKVGGFWLEPRFIGERRRREQGGRCLSGSQFRQSTIMKKGRERCKI